MSQKRILVVLTNQATYGHTSRKTGSWLSEITHPLARFRAKGFAVDFASPKGGAAPVDPDSLDHNDPINAAFLADPTARGRLETTLPLVQIAPEGYQALFLAGGMGVMWDFPEDERLGDLATGFYDQGKIVAAVCHGPAGLLAARTRDGTPLLAGRAVSGFSNEEETLAGHDGLIPFRLEDALKAKDARYEKAPPWQAKVVVSERLITGQNPSSAGPVADAVIAALV